MAQIFLALGAALAGLGVALGAFASHILKPKLTESSLATFEKGTRYQMYHAIALLFVGLLLKLTQEAEISLIFAGYSFIIGILTFCGSLYALSLGGIKWMGAVAPIGGLAFLAGWGLLAVGAFG